MNDGVLKKLINEYDSLDDKSEETCIKYIITIGDVKVNLYFDNYDIENPSLVMIIVYDGVFFFTNLSYSNGRFSNFINFIDKSSDDYRVICAIMDEDNSLNEFYARIENRILNSNRKVTLYVKDKIFTNTMLYNKKANKELPFIQTIKKAKMSDEMYDFILETMGVSKDVLNRFRDSGYTFVRTGDLAKRRKISFLINKL
ncbi:MAG: hypothetical protein IJ593_00510 [Lachnospiraceae bacterium]|nr:hypothetical protein [Lachnospiraceae bacterium]